MRYSDFINKLENVSNSYCWNIDNKKVTATIRSGPLRGFTLNPITALAHKCGLGFFDNNRDETEYAARLLGISRKLARNVYSATIGSYNHGNVQVVRGKIRSALEV
jgi:hypothetical protein